MTPALPLSVPFKQRLDKLSQSEASPDCLDRTDLNTSAGKERERPKRRLETIVPRRPQRSTGLRPTLSERRLHWSTVTASAAKYKDIYNSLLSASYYERTENRRDVLLDQRSIRPFFRHHQRLGTHGQAKVALPTTCVIGMDERTSLM